MDEQRGRSIVKLSMNRHFKPRFFTGIILGLIAVPVCGVAQSASDLAAGLRAKQEGSTFVRVRMQISSGQILQVQIKSRVSDAASDIVYQILFPKERKGESVLLHRSGNKFTGSLFKAPDTLKQIGAGEMNQALFGTDLSYEDIIDSPF